MDAGSGSLKGMPRPLAGDGQARKRLPTPLPSPLDPPGFENRREYSHTHEEVAAVLRQRFLA